ncbi:MAG: GNAT family N-acetyltransferase [Desulfurococcales archaeon]|nr:GNAT family N-acetyltransferase [Desulfurococcales archaeon]
MRGSVSFVEVDAGSVGMVFGLVRRVYRGFEEVTLEGLRSMVSSSMLSMVALYEGEPVAFASSQGLPGVVEVRSLAAAPGYGWALESLLKAIALRLEPGLGGRLFRMVALSTPSIVSATSSLGLEARRRILKVKWTLSHTTDTCSEGAPEGVAIVRVSDYGSVGEVARSYLESLSTHWRWWIDSDMGGYEGALREVKEWIESGPERWYAALLGDTVVGASGYKPHPRLRGVAWLAGVAVKPEHRLRGVGRALLCRVLDSAMSEGFREAVVYTYSPIIGLAPGATLYIKTGGSIQAEYIHFETPPGLQGYNI